MKRLYIILMSIAMLLMWFTFAADFDVSVTPNTQNAISGTVVWFDISVTNNTGVSAYVMSDVPYWLHYSSSNVIPDNNPALALWLEINPRWLLSANQSLTIHMDAVVQVPAFFVQDILFNVVEYSNLLNIYTWAMVQLEPISDVIVKKILIWNEPHLTGDAVIYGVEIKNIGSKTATWIKLVDVWPSNALVFPNTALVFSDSFGGGISQIPTIYNWLVDNYLFVIPDLVPYGTAFVEIVWSMDVLLPYGQTFDNSAFVLVDSNQYDLLNDNTTLTNRVVWFADVEVEVFQTSSNPIQSWDLIWYRISYRNVGTETWYVTWVESILSNNVSFLSSNPAYSVVAGSYYRWGLGDLSPWQSGEILMTGVFVWSTLSWDISNTLNIITSSSESNTNNSSVATGEMQEISDMSVELYANNLTDPSRNFDTGTQIFAISGDMVELEIIVNNNGNMLETGTVSISNINGFVNYVWVTSWNVNLVVWSSQVINLTWIVGPQNYISFTPVANLSYDSLLETDDVIIQEPFECGDGLITQWEPCDINGQIWDMLPWQHCEEQNGQCVIVTEDIINTVCMEYTTDLWTGEQCMSMIVPYEELTLQAECSHMSAPYSVVIVDEDNEWEMPFTCETVDNIVADEIIIDCGNGDIGTAYATSTFIYNCNYEYDEDGDDADNIYEVVCVVDDNDDVSEDCRSSVRVDEWFYGVCGDGTIDDGEECDLWWDEDEEIDIDRYLDEDRDYRAGRYEDAGYYCEDCRIRESETNEYVYQPPQCLWTNVPISVMENEQLPFRWRLRDRDNMKIKNDYSCGDMNENETKTIIARDSMKCDFAVYNGKDYSQSDDNPMGEFTLPCFNDDNSELFDYFAESDTYGIDFNKVSGRHVESVEEILEETIDTYGEYKLVLEEVRYDYCNPELDDWPDREEWRTYNGICEVNFTLTRPYLMQISTFGITPVASDASDFLNDFYDIWWNKLVDSADIDDILEVSATDYVFDNDTMQQMSDFKSRYGSLAIAVDSSFKINGSDTIEDLFGVDTEVKKVPNKRIFFVNWNWELTLKQLTNYFPVTPFTIYVEGMDVVVEWSVKTNGMIVTDQKIYFEDDQEENNCEVGWQVVQGIFVAQDWFAAEEELRNDTKNAERCERWNLRVKWVLIWKNVDNLMDNRRSHLNDWFQVDNDSEMAIERERRQEIFEWAALLIEYNPELWNALPPGAESFTQSLDVYRN